MKKAEATQEVARLISKLDSLTKREFKKYDEENTKKDFILPLFRALGWATEDRREVTAEDKVSRRRVDYAFRIEGIPKFFLEAKPLKADLDNPEYAWQAINYAWTKGVTWAALTDFEGLKVFNAQWKGPSLLYNRFLDIPYTGYLERFDELWLLSRESFEKGLLDIEAEKVGKKAKREAVGKQLFDDLIVWRQKLYKQLRGWNKEYSEAQIDEAVQRILDRLIFIRTAEDRELEERVLLPAVREWRENGRRKELDKALGHIFREFDKKYDSELFEVGHFCEDIYCDSNTYARVIEGLYGMRDEVPTYAFDAIDVDVLGGIYEQYLSYRQGLPEEVEEAKRRRRKKRGIYYTPKFVVEYIVENTVGRLLQERSHDEIRKLRILDPACGSGSFLIEAFEMLARYHQELKGGIGEPLVGSRKREGTSRREGTGKREGTSPSPTDQEYDEFLERLRILRDNIYGVDLDPQAVEIARLNLLLKTLHRRALLPKLEDNIRCGNSLISGMPIELSQYFGADWEGKRPFNWEEEFPKIMEEDGFDVVIGNPPYVADVGFSAQEREYHRAQFESATGKYDLYMLFIERGLALCKPSGYFSYIVPNKFMQTKAGRGLRRYILANSEILEILDFGDTGVFRDAMNYPCILILRKNGRAKRVFFPFKKANGYPDRIIEETSVDQDSLSEDVWIFAPAREMELYERLVAQNPPLEEWVERIFTGIQSGADKLLVFSAEECKKRKYEKEMLRPILRGRDIKRYSVQWGRKYIFYPYSRKAGAHQIVGERELKKSSALYSHLSSHRSRLSERVWFDQTAEELSGAWYGLMYIGDPEWFTSRKLITPALSAIPNFTLDEQGYLFFTGTAGGYGLTLGKEFDSKKWYLYLLGVLNSKITEFCIKKVSPMFSGGFYKFNTQYLKPLPIRRIDFDNPQDVKMHDDLVALVERMLDLHKRLKDAVGEEKKDLERQTARTDGQIDDLVYQLYNITEKERQIIEGKM